MLALKRIAAGGRASSLSAAQHAATRATAAAMTWNLPVLCRRMSIAGFPHLPGPGSFSPLPSPLTQQPLPSVDSLPSPLRQHMPPLSPRGAGIDSPSRDDRGARGDDEDEEDERNRGTGAGPPTPPPVSRRHPGGIESGNNGGGGGGGAAGGGAANGRGKAGIPEPPPAPVESEKGLHERGPHRPSDTPPLPDAPQTPDAMPSEQTQLEREAQQRAEDARRIQRAARGQPSEPRVQESILPPPPGSDFGAKSPAEHRAAAAGFHKTGPADRHRQEVPSDETGLDSNGKGNPLALIWKAVKIAFKNAAGGGRK